MMIKKIPLLWKKNQIKSNFTRIQDKTARTTPNILMLLSIRLWLPASRSIIISTGLITIQLRSIWVRIFRRGFQSIIRIQLNSGLVSELIPPFGNGSGRDMSVQLARLCHSIKWIYSRVSGATVEFSRKIHCRRDTWLLFSGTRRKSRRRRRRRKGRRGRIRRGRQEISRRKRRSSRRRKIVGSQ